MNNLGLYDGTDHDFHDIEQQNRKHLPNRKHRSLTVDQVRLNPGYSQVFTENVSIPKKTLENT